MPYRFRAGTAAVLLAATAATAQQPPARPDPIAAAKVQRQIADQQFRSAVAEEVETLVKLARTHHAKAVADLKALSRKVLTRNDVSAAAREAMSALVDGKLAAVEKGAATVVPPPGTAGADRREANAKAVEAAATEAKEVRDGVAYVAAQYEAGKPKDAQRREAELAAKYPNNPAVLALGRAGGTRDVLDESKWLAAEQGRRFVATMNGVQRSAIPIAGDIEYPKDWAEKTARMRKREADLIGPEEKAVLRSLEAKVERSLRGVPFDEAILQLSTLINQNIYLDKDSIEALGIDLRKPVDVPGNVDARTVLRAILQTQGLTFIIRDKVIQVMSVEKARQNMVTRSYEVRDLVQNAATTFGAGSIAWAPYLDYDQTQKNVQTVIDAIVGGIDPRVWAKNGGPATVIFHYPSMSLIVRAPAEVHSALGSKLGR